jgi:hypothetical protein
LSAGRVSVVHIPTLADGTNDVPAQLVGTQLRGLYMKFALSISFALAIFSSSLHAQSPSKSRDTVLLGFSTTAGAMTAWGIARWGWFQHSPKFKREGWFGANTHAGGADKTGHFYMSYALADLLLWDFRRQGVNKPEKTAALTALATMTLLEIGDATSSKYGFSFEDLIADAGGVLASWALATNPQLDELIDIRMEYWPSAGFDLTEDAASDYSGMRHLIALKGDAIERFSNTPLRWLELQTGYYTRGFRSFDRPLENGPERHVYVGVGISLPTVFKRHKAARTFFSYLQPPNLNLSTSYQF